MPRRSYKPYRRNYGSNKKKWASFMKAASSPTISVPGSGSAFGAVDLVVNSAESATPTPTIIKCKHFKASIDTYVTSSTSTQIGPLVCYIMYVPQGYTLATTTPIDHPEWVMSWRAVDVSLATTLVTFHNNITMSSSLSRNLNSGDSVKLIIVANNVTSNNYTVNGLIHFSCVVRNN